MMFNKGDIIKHYNPKDAKPVYHDLDYRHGDMWVSTSNIMLNPEWLTLVCKAEDRKDNRKGL